MTTTAKIKGKTITFDLETMGNGVCLKATHIDGKEHHSGYLIRIKNDGTFEREVGVEETFGFKLNNVGQIKKSED